MTSRRGLLRGFAGALALPASWHACAQSLQAAGDPSNENYWRMVKRQFPLEDGLTYLNAANVCPASRPVMDRYLEYLRDFHANPSFQNRDKYQPLQERLRGKLAALLHAAADEIAITRNTSEGSNFVVNGIDLKPGDEVIITAHNHPSSRETWQVRARRHHLELKELPVPVPARSRDELIATIERAITPRTRVLVITHLTSTAGLLYPAREIAAITRRRNVWMHLDGAQTFGAMDVNLREIGCDSYSGSAHKWPMGPLECGVLFVRADRHKEMWPSIVTAGWSDKLIGARKYEVLGQRDNPRLVAFEAAVDFLNLIGMANIESRVRALADRARRRLIELPGIKLKTNVEPELAHGIVKFQIGNRNTDMAYDHLWVRNRIATSHTSSGDAEGVRFSPHVYNTLEDIDQAVAAVRGVAS